MPGRDSYRPRTSDPPKSDNIDSYRPLEVSDIYRPKYTDRVPRARRAGRRERGKASAEDLGASRRSDRFDGGGIRKRPSAKTKHAELFNGRGVSKAVKTTMPPNTPFRGFFLVPQAHWQRIETFLTQNELAYEYFHASFINACHKLVRRVDNPECRVNDDWEVGIREILKDYPVPAAKYIEALQLYKDACDPPKEEIAGRPIKSTNRMSRDS